MGLSLTSYGYEYRYNLLYCVYINSFSDTARTYDPESDMTVVVGVPTYYSEKSRVMIRFSHIHTYENRLLITFVFARAVTA